MNRAGTIKAVSKFHKLSICDGLEALATRNYNTAFPFHFHRTYNISLVYEGVFRTKVRERSLYAPTGAILITNPLEVHSNPCESNERISFFTFYVNPEFINHYTKQTLVFCDNIIYDDELFKKLHEIAIQIENEGGAGTIEDQLTPALHNLFSRHAFSSDGKDNLSSHHSLFTDYLA
ncbi:MAG: AraC family ligand binding domain-containing protein, partial [Chitinophagaceae bacterium]